MIPLEISPPQSASAGERIVNRYRDAYRVASVVVGFGRTLKIIGWLLGGICLLGGLIAAANSYSHDRIAYVLIGIAAGSILLLLLWIVGVIVSAVGQQLRASLDCAVHGSPFLSDQQRAQAMGFGL